eukprot:Skav207279  [mRNA]  locus=scaffold434:148234:149660:- [translate_table: standard]
MAEAVPSGSSILAALLRPCGAGEDATSHCRELLFVITREGSRVYVRSGPLPQFMENRYDICERNTFLDFPAPKPLPLEKAQTDPPPGLEGIYGRKFVSETEQSEDSTAADDAEEAPPPLPLEVFVTPDCFEDVQWLAPEPPKTLSAAAPAFIPCAHALPGMPEPSTGMSAAVAAVAGFGSIARPFQEIPEREPRQRKQISLEEMLQMPSLEGGFEGQGSLDEMSPPLVPMPVPGGAPKWLPAPPAMPAPVLAEPPSPEAPRNFTVAHQGRPVNSGLQWIAMAG